MPDTRAPCVLALGNFIATNLGVLSSLYADFLPFNIIIIIQIVPNKAKYF